MWATLGSWERSDAVVMLETQARETESQEAPAKVNVVFENIPDPDQPPRALL